MLGIEHDTTHGDEPPSVGDATLCTLLEVAGVNSVRIQVICEIPVERHSCSYACNVVSLLRYEVGRCGETASMAVVGPSAFFLDSIVGRSCPAICVSKPPSSHLTSDFPSLPVTLYANPIPCLTDGVSL